MTRLLYLISLSWKSSWNRRGTLLLIILSIALSTTLLLGIEKTRVQVRENFVQAVSGTDLVIGARGSNVQLILYAIFHLGGATNNMGWNSAELIAKKPEVDWVIPISLGDTHQGYPVVATNENMFKHYRYQKDKHLVLAKGQQFEGLFDVVIGSEVAKNLNYELGQKVVLSHGNSTSDIAQHGDKPFQVAGILAPTGTPVDRSLYISLEAMEAIHLNWQSGAPIPGLNIPADQITKFDLKPKSITALLVGLKKRSHVFAVQKSVNDWRSESLMAVMPGVVMDQIWSMMNSAEKVLLIVSALVTVVGLAGLTATILAGLGERRRELAILRSAGAKPTDILCLLACEGLMLLVIGVLIGIVSLTLLIILFSPLLMDKYGIAIYLSLPTNGEWLLLGAIMLAGLCTSMIPAWRAYRMSLVDGLSVSK